MATIYFKVKEHWRGKAIAEVRRELARIADEFGIPNEDMEKICLELLDMIGKDL